MNIVFFGSDDFAAIHLQKLIDQGYRVVACVTPPDKPQGRGMHTSASPVKECALLHQLPVCHPQGIFDSAFAAELQSFNADIFVVIAYGKILPQALLDIPKVFSLNVHASLLPQYRGAAPINWAILNGEQQTGVSIIKLNTEMDAGDILAQEQMPIEEQDTAVTLRRRLAELGSELLAQTLKDITEDQYTLKVQDADRISYAPKLKKSLGEIDFRKSAISIHNLVRGLLPWPSAYTWYQGKLLKLLQTQVVPNIDVGTPGEIIEISQQGFVVVTGDGGLCVERVHLESAKAMDSNSFVSGHKLELGMQLGKT